MTQGHPNFIQEPCRALIVSGSSVNDYAIIKIMTVHSSLSIIDVILHMSVPEGFWRSIYTGLTTYFQPMATVLKQGRGVS